MRYFVFVIGFIFIISSSVMAQVEKGDKEIQLLGSITLVEDASTAMIQGTYGIFVTPQVELGVGPSIWYFSAGGFSTTIIGSVFFGRYNFSVDTKQVPYVSALWYQQDFSPDYGDFTDYSYLQFGGGVKFFINEHIAYDTSANLGFALGGGSVAFTVMGGLSAFF